MEADTQQLLACWRPAATAFRGRIHFLILTY